MSKYHEVVYGNYPKSTFPRKLIEHLLRNHWPKSSKFESYNQHIISSMHHDIRVLDLGCGDCTYLEEGFWGFHFADGIDFGLKYQRGMGRVEPGKINTTNEKYPIDLNADNLPYPNDSFDIIFSKSVIEHINNTDHLLKEILRVLKPGGKLIILTPAWEYNYKDFFNDYTHVKPFHRKGLQDALKINYFSDVKVEYFYHLPLLWKYPFLKFGAKIISLLSPFKWKDKDESKHRVWIRFSQEIQLLATATKEMK